MATMSMLSSALLFLCLFALAGLSISDTPPSRAYLINCGGKDKVTAGGVEWVPDDVFIGVGNSSKVDTPGILPQLSTLRYFPDGSARKYCYVIPVSKGAKYIVRTTYYYGGYDGGKEPPVFDQIIGGTKWSTVNTTENYARGLTAYYEIIAGASGKTMSVCLARNEHTAGSPFISAIELQYLEDSMYNSTDFNSYALATIARHRFGGKGRQLISYPDDPFNRNWQLFTDDNPSVTMQWNASSSDFWNLPPLLALMNATTTSRGKELVIPWPPIPLPAANYYMALYFQDNHKPSPFSWRVFDVSVNGQVFYKGLNVSAAGVMVYGTSRSLSGQTTIKLIPDANSTVGPLINAAEILQVVPIGGRTLTRDVIAMEDLARSLTNRPSDWSGDPCLPQQHSWTGVTCSSGKLARVVTLNLTSYGISGSLPASIGTLTSVSSILLGGNKISGPIPDMGALKELVSLHLENNQLTGSIPQSLGNLPKIKEIFLQGNQLQGGVPDSLKKRSGVDIQTGSGNEAE
ncbi:putative LRR receptor-like serine/threonine-protein kinase [Iris pallida]|uniref:LRR receptor-like serine/threonine-protein kinase n=1 Tax=Iris pallida TaxID=29817 RepID=A0AAX6HEX8_IRIPA|nr:putative LRR receptor-like serine/threonine-protein kinase [Iris pallida]